MVKIEYKISLSDFKTNFEFTTNNGDFPRSKSSIVDMLTYLNDITRVSYITVCLIKSFHCFAQ